MEKPQVSIIVTCYNRAGMVTKALDSVYAQTWRPLELLIVDDGSKDNSWEVIQKWCAEHPSGGGFTCTAKSFPNGKLCVARNRGIEMSHGGWIQYVDDDDWLYPFAIEEKMKAAAEHPEWDIIVNQVDYRYVGIGIKGHSRLTVPKEKEKQLLHVLNPENDTYFSPTLMFRRNTLIECGAWTPGLLFADDIDVIIRAAISGACFGLVDQPLSVYNMHDELRQCNNMIYRLADDFWSGLFLRLYDTAVKAQKDSPELKRAFAAQCTLYAQRLVRWGKFRAAELTFEAGKRISGEENFRMKLPAPFRFLEFFFEHLVFSCKQNTKHFIKKMIGRGK